MKTEYDTEEINLATIEALTRDYARAHECLTERVKSLEEERSKITRQRMPGIKSAAVQIAEAHALLKAAIEAGPHLFQKPRTLVIHGVKVGLQKGKGEIKFANPENVIRLIRKHLSDQEDQLIATKESLVKAALSKLSIAELKKIGCQIVDTDDQVVIKAATAEIDKLVSALLAEADKLEDLS